MIALATRTASGNPAPVGFVVTLWVLVVLFLGGAGLALVQAYRARGDAPTKQDAVAQSGRRMQAGCLVMFAIPAILVGLFLLSWVIQVQ